MFLSLYDEVTNVLCLSPLSHDEEVDVESYWINWITGLRKGDDTHT
jgi:hypothetical protein